MFKQARALELYPDGRDGDSSPCVVIESTGDEQSGAREDLRYDVLLDSTGRS